MALRLMQLKLGRVVDGKHISVTGLAVAHGGIVPLLQFNPLLGTNEAQFAVGHLFG